MIRLSIISFLIIAIAQCSQEGSPESQVIIGPYLQSMSDEEVTICWSIREGVTRISEGDSIVQEVSQYRHHKSIITRLKPNTTYSYDVLQDGTSNGKGTFTTFPDSISPFHFTVLGDTRTRHEYHQRIVDRMIQEDPLFVVNTGDLVSRGNSMEDWEHFFRINDSLTRHVPYFTVLGNHEQNSENYFNFFSLPGNESYYFFPWGMPCLLYWIWRDRIIVHPFILRENTWMHSGQISARSISKKRKNGWRIS